MVNSISEREKRRTFREPRRPHVSSLLELEIKMVMMRGAYCRRHGLIVCEFQTREMKHLASASVVRLSPIYGGCATYSIVQLKLG
jgi:hypothetical protein